MLGVRLKAWVSLGAWECLPPLVELRHAHAVREEDLVSVVSASPQHETHVSVVYTRTWQRARAPASDQVVSTRAPTSRGGRVRCGGAAGRSPGCVRVHSSKVTYLAAVAAGSRHQKSEGLVGERMGLRVCGAGADVAAPGKYRLGVVSVAIVCRASADVAAPRQG
eukprot:scaffold40391_cov65-Phaeocystis_antarctica.AAC.1